MTKTIRTLPVALTLLLAACSDGTLETGGGSGDANPDAGADIVILAPFAGLYDLTGNWQGNDSDVAYLALREPDDEGEAVVVLTDIDEVDGCSERPRYGTLLVDRATGSPQVFLNGIYDLDSALLSRGTDGTLRIVISDVNDIDNDGNRSDRVTLTAPVIAATEQDTIPPSCS